MFESFEIDQKHKCKLLGIEWYRFLVLKKSYGWKTMFKIRKTEFLKNVKKIKKNETI